MGLNRHPLLALLIVAPHQLAQAVSSWGSPEGASAGLRRLSPGASETV